MKIINYINSITRDKLSAINRDLQKIKLNRGNDWIELIFIFFMGIYFLTKSVSVVKMYLSKHFTTNKF